MTRSSLSDQEFVKFCAQFADSRTAIESLFNMSLKTFLVNSKEHRRVFRSRKALQELRDSLWAEWYDRELGTDYWKETMGEAIQAACSNKKVESS